jgi:hypothetical protein
LALWFIRVLFTLFRNAPPYFFLFEGYCTCCLALDMLLAASMRVLLFEEVGRYLFAEKSPTVEACGFWFGRKDPAWKESPKRFVYLFATKEA